MKLQGHAMAAAALQAISCGLLICMGFSAPAVHHAFRVLGHRRLANFIDRHTPLVAAAMTALAPHELFLPALCMTSGAVLRNLCLGKEVRTSLIAALSLLPLLCAKWRCML